MALLIGIEDMGTAETKDVADTLGALSAELFERDTYVQGMDIREIMAEALSDNCFTKPRTIKSPWKVGETLVVIPSVPPPYKSSPAYGKRYEMVMPVIRVPGDEPAMAYAQDSETYVDSQSYTLRGNRQVIVHRAVPGMIITFHHYEGEAGIHERTAMNVVRLVFDNGQLKIERLPEAMGIMDMPGTKQNRDF